MSSTDLTVPSGSAVTAAPMPREYLSFRLGGEEYGIDILRVQEIRGYEAPTRIANAPAFVKGVINLRGNIVPIVDLRLRFGCENVDFDGTTVTIVLNVGHRVVGVVVDAVSDVMEIEREAIRPAPELSSTIDSNFITGLAHLDARMLILLDIAGLLSSPGMGLVDTAD